MPIEVVIEPPPIKVYIAGPMSGLPEYNYPAFYKAEEKLKVMGYEAMNPARNPKQENWQLYMRQAITLMMRCDCIFLLPGWTSSRGALLEHEIASSIAMPVAYPENWCPESPNPWEGIYE